jgi:hypothetical protein
VNLINCEVVEASPAGSEPTLTAEDNAVIMGGILLMFAVAAGVAALVRMLKS